MNIMNFILAVTMLWVVLFFISVPLFLKMPDKQEVGHAIGAPEKHYFGFKILVTFLISVLIAFAINYYKVIDF